MMPKPFFTPTFQAGRRVCRLLALSLLAASTVLAAPQTRAAQEEGTEGDDAYTEEVLQEGPGWRLVNARGQAPVPGREDELQAYDRKLIMVQGRAGVLNAPLPRDIQEELAADAQAGETGENGEADDAVFSLDLQTLDEMAYAEQTGELTPYLEAIAEPLGGEEEDGDASAKGMEKASCGDQDKVYTRGLNLGQSIPFYNFNLGSGFTGNLAVSGNVNGTATGEVYYKVKRRKVLWVFCVPYGIQFDRARAHGNLLIDYGATLSGTLNYTNPSPWETQIAKPQLGSVTFFVGYLPVYIGFNLPIDLGLELQATLTGSVSYNTGQVAQGSFDYTCWTSHCAGSNNFATTGSQTPAITAGISGHIKPSVWANVSIRAFLYTEWLVYVQVGLRGYLHGDLWGYYGNNCGDADQDGTSETVDALTFDLDWQLKVNGAASALGSNPARFTLWTSPRWHINYWDLIGSEALQPMLVGPAAAIVNTPEPYHFKMRPCWPYGDTMNYSILWEAGGTPQSHSGAPQSFATLSHTWPTTGYKGLALTAVSDSHGRNLGKTTRRRVKVGYWTRWLNRDQPSGVGDYETLVDFMNEGYNVCNGTAPIDIQCRTTPGQVPWQSAGQVYSCAPSTGGVCVNSHQKIGSCLDYEVRFFCF